MRKDKKVIEHLEGELQKASETIGDLLKQNATNEETIKRLYSELDSMDEKYSVLLQRYISTMEKAINLPKPKVENKPDLQVVNIFQEFDALITKWFEDNYLDAYLWEGFAKLKIKYLGDEENE